MNWQPPENEEATYFRKWLSQNGRGGEIRTHDLYVPNVALYQAKLRPDSGEERLISSLRESEASRILSRTHGAQKKKKAAS
jgi:hypothetical protein